MPIDPSEVIQDQDGIPSNEVKVDAQPTSILDSEVKLDTPEGGIPEHEVVPDQSHSTPMQTGIAALEGAAKGATFGLSTKAEAMAGVDPKDIIARQQENPLVAIGSEAAGTIGSMFVPGVGEGWLLGKAAKLTIPLAKDASMLAKTGRLALRGAMETMGMASGDELSDAFLDKGHDATAVASHIAGSGALGLLTGGILAGKGNALEAIQNQNLGEYLDNFAIGLGSASEGGNVDHLAQIYKDSGVSVPKGMLHGMKFYAETSDKIAKTVADTASHTAGALGGAVAGSVAGPIGATIGTGIGYKMAEKYIDPTAERLASKYAPTITKKVAVPIMLQAIKLGEYSGLSNALNYGTKAAKGAQAINKSIDSLLKVGSSKSLDFEINEKDNEKLNKYIENGGIDQQMNEFQENPNSYAEGGVVKAKPLSSDGVSKLYPAQHMMVTSTKTRVSNYLNSIRPQPPMGQHVFDEEHKDKEKEKSYANALHMANQPLAVLQHVQDGTLDMDKMKHFVGMYPEVHDHLAKKITSRLVDHKTEETKPSYKIRQGLSLFLGAPLESALTPQSIIAAQGTFAPKNQPQQQQQAQKKSKKGTAPLSKASKDYKTTTQEAESDRSARD